MKDKDESKLKRYLKFTVKQHTDSGMALVLILLLAGYIYGNIIFFKIAIPVLFINMIYPRIVYPFSFIWYGLSRILGKVMSSLLLSLIFIIMVLPLGWIRRHAGRDSLYLRDFKKSNTSVFRIRNHSFDLKDILKPY